MKTATRRAICYGATLFAGVVLGWLVTRSKESPEVARPAVEDSPPPDVAALSMAMPTAAKPPAEARGFDPLSAAASGELALLIRQFRAADDEARRLEILERIDAHHYGKDFLGLAREILDPATKVATAVLRARVLEMLAGNTSPEILPVLETVRGSPSEDERMKAVLASARVRDRQVVDFIARFFEDPEKSVRFSALEAVAIQPRESRGTLLVRAMHGAHQDVALVGLAELELDASPATMPLLFEGFSSPHAEVREDTLRTAGFLLDEDFESAAAAIDWWEANRRRFDRNLIRIE